MQFKKPTTTFLNAFLAINYWMILHTFLFTLVLRVPPRKGLRKKEEKWFVIWYPKGNQIRENKISKIPRIKFFWSKTIAHHSFLISMVFRLAISHFIVWYIIILNYPSIWYLLYTSIPIKSMRFRATILICLNI